MSASEFVGWMDYYDQEPFGAMRDNWHAAQLAALTYNAHRGRGSVPKSTRDFMYEPPASAAERKDAEFLEKLRSKARASRGGQ